MAKEKVYKRLPGKGRGLFAYTTLWLGRDHLLMVKSDYFSEEYKRFYFGDIQALITQKSHHGKWISIIAAMLALVFSLFLLDGWSHVPGTLVFVFSLLLLVNWLRGPTCSAYIRTAIQTERLGALNRLRSAQRVMDRLRPLIEGVQGALRPEDVAFAPSSEAPTRTPPRGVLPPGITPALRHERGRAHAVLFSGLLLDGINASVDFFLTHWIFVVAGDVLFFGMSISAVMALVRQHGSDLGRGVKNLTWASLFYLIFFFLYGMSLYFMVVLPRMDTYAGIAAYDYFEIIQTISFCSPSESIWFLVMSLLNIAGGLTLGLWGWLLLRRPHVDAGSPRKRAVPGSGQTMPVR